MKLIFTAAFLALLGFARAQNTPLPTTPAASPNSTLDTRAQTTVPTFPMTNVRRRQLQQTAPTTADTIQDENRITQERAQQAIRTPNSTYRGTQTVCLKTDKQCLREEARNRINQNNGTQKDNPTDLNNRPSY